MLPKLHALAGKEEAYWRGCDRRQVSGSRRYCARKGKWLGWKLFVAQCCEELLEALTLTCGVVDSS
jgi:hypothetical protein